MALRFQLNNGLTVVFEEQHEAKVAAFQVWVRAGSGDERDDQAGLAHLHEHMLFKGTPHRGPGEIAHTIEAHGGEINAWTSFDQTVYHVVIASQYAKMGLDVLADAVKNSQFDAGELSREIEVVCEEIKRGLDMPARRASQALFSTTYQVHPYRRPVIGWENTVRGFDRTKVLEFYRQHYNPKSVVLVAVGDLAEKEFRAWAEELFGNWNPSVAPPNQPNPRILEPTPKGRRFNLVPDPSKEAWVQIAFPIPAMGHPDVPALDLLSFIVGQGDSSRLSLEVKRKGQWANDVHTYAYTPQDPGMFTLSVNAQPEKLERALSEALSTLLVLKHSPVEDSELTTVKAIVEADAIYQRETVQGMARKLGFYQSSTGGLEEEARYLDQVMQSSAADLLRVAQKYLDLSIATVTGLLPEGCTFTHDTANALLDKAASENPRTPAPRKRSEAPAEHVRLTGSQNRSGAKGSKVLVEKLPSGAQVIIRPERNVPLFAFRAAYLGGTRFETEANNGLNVLLARMLTRGTPNMDAEQISHLVDELAGSMSASTGRNSFSLRGEFLTKHFHRAFGLATDLLLNPLFPEDELAREKSLLLQDVATRDDQPSSVAFDLFHKALFLKHPYRLHIGGEQRSLEALGRKELQAFHAAYLDPSQLTLSVVGDVDVDEVLALCHQAFGKSKGSAAPPPQIANEAAPDSPRQSSRSLARAQAHVVYGFRGVTINDPMRRSLEVLSTLLSGQGGRLFLELRDKQSLAYSVTSYSMEGLDPGYFAVYMGTSPEKVPAALDGIRRELEKIRSEPVSEAELTRARRNLIGGHEIGLQRNGARAALLALERCYGLPPEDAFQYAQQIEAVTAADVLLAAQKIINFDRSALSVVGPDGLKVDPPTP